MVLENIIRKKIIELENQAEELIQELGNEEDANFNLFAVDVLKEIIEQYNNGAP